jgi:S1-C subfamily serine protease
LLLLGAILTVAAAPSVAQALRPAQLLAQAPVQAVPAVPPPSGAAPKLTLPPGDAPSGNGPFDLPPGPGAPVESREVPFLLETVVRVEVKAAAGAESAGSLGARRSGTGVLIDRSTVLTIGYLLLEADELELVTADGKRVPASVAGYDAISGFGVIRSVLPLEGKPLELGDSDAVREMQKVLTLGHGEGLPTELLVVSRKPFAGSWEYVLDSGIFTYPPVNNWSGAALVDQDGKLVGIGSLLVNDAAADQTGIPGNLYVPVNLLKPILKDLLATGRRAGPPQPWMGVTTEVVKGNLIVSRVTPGGPAEAAGLATGDVIVAVGTTLVDNQTDFYREVWKLGPAGVTVPLRVLKAGDVRDVPVRTIDRMSLLRKPQGI